jgi:hypothetical protein
MLVHIQVRTAQTRVLLHRRAQQGRSSRTIRKSRTRGFPTDGVRDLVGSPLQLLKQGDSKVKELLVSRPAQTPLVKSRPVTTIDEHSVFKDFAGDFR